MNYHTIQATSRSVPLRNYNQPEWQGQRSCKFTKTLKYIPKQDNIKKNFDIPDQSIYRGRWHYRQPLFYQNPYRSSLQKKADITYWIQRETRVKMFDFHPTENPLRKQKLHLSPLRNPQRSMEGKKTFYQSNMESQRQYRVEDNMQRKGKVNLTQIRRSYIKKAAFQL